HLADSLMFVPLWLMMSMVDLLSSYQSAKINLGMPQLPSVAFYYLILIFVVVAIRCQRWLTLAGPLFVLAVYGLVWQPRAPALSIALFPSRLVLIDGARHAVAASYASLGSSKNALQERDIQRFICYSAANFHSEEFAVVHLDERTEVIWQPHRSWCVAVCAGDRQSLKGSLNAALKLIGGRPEITSTVIVIRVPAGNAGQWIGRAASLLPHDFEQRGIHILMVTDEHWSIYRPARPPLLLPSRVGNIPIVESNGVRCESEAASRRFRQLVDIQVESVKQIEK
ncbi:MAG TPA: hypothetical protein V6C72_17440, partial [Chroococcales cyanobacterium]